MRTLLDDSNNNDTPSTNTFWLAKKSFEIKVDNQAYQPEQQISVYVCVPKRGIQTNLEEAVKSATNEEQLVNKLCDGSQLFGLHQDGTAEDARKLFHGNNNDFILFQNIYQKTAYYAKDSAVVCKEAIKNNLGQIAYYLWGFGSTDTPKFDFRCRLQVVENPNSNYDNLIVLWASEQEKQNKHFNYFWIDKGFPLK